MGSWGVLGWTVLVRAAVLVWDATRQLTRESIQLELVHVEQQTEPLRTRRHKGDPKPDKTKKLAHETVCAVPPRGCKSCKSD